MRLLRLFLICFGLVTIVSAQVPWPLCHPCPKKPDKKKATTKYAGKVAK